MRRPPTVGIAVSLAVHLFLLALLIGVGAPTKIYTVNRGEPLFVELPKAEENAQRGQAAAPEPAPPAPKASPVPPAPKAPPQPKAEPPAPKAPPQARAPQVARAEPPPRPAPRVAETPAPRQPAPRVPAPQETPAPDGTRPVQPPPPASAPPAPAPPAATAPPQPEAPRSASPAPESPPAQAPQGLSKPSPQIAAVPPSREPMVDIRRRPGAPGAGGAGEGRAGIEGEPIPLNSTDKQFADYLIRVKRMIQEKWVYPCVRAATGECEYKSANLIVEFGILRNGQVPYVTVHQPAAWDIYDSVAVTAIKLAAPFPPVPASLMATRKPGSTGVPIVAHFHYVLESTSIMNFLR